MFEQFEKLEKIGVTEEFFEEVRQKAENGEDPVLVLARSNIDISEIKSIISEVRVEAVKFIVSFLSEFLSKHLSKTDKELIQKLDNGDDDAFKKLIQIFKEEFSKNKLISEQKEHKAPKFEFTVDHIFNFFNEDVKNYLCRAAACALLEVPKAAEANMEMAMLKTFEVFNMHRATDEVIKKKGELKRASEVSKKANKTRHAKNNMIRAHAIKLYDEGNFPSARNAARKLAPIIMDYAVNSEELKAIEGTDKRFDCLIQTADTIERWIGAHKKAKKQKLNVMPN